MLHEQTFDKLYSMKFVGMAEGFKEQIEQPPFCRAPCFEAACARALALKADSYKNMESILKKELDQQPLNASSPQTRLPLLEHQHLWGRKYYP